MADRKLKQIRFTGEFVFDPDDDKNADGSTRVPDDDNVKESIFQMLEAMMDRGWQGGGKWEWMEDADGKQDG